MVRFSPTLKRQAVGGGEPILELASFRGDLASLRAARGLIADTLTDATDEVRDAVVLCADELITNAVRHGGGSFEVKVQTDGLTVRVSVRDAEPASPVLRPPREEGERGRGMHIVDVVSSRWGCERSGRGKVVWFEVPASHDAAATEAP
jgi:anti-sigma regulatory factor (Ser/Thr protein kinase)